MPLTRRNSGEGVWGGSVQWRGSILQNLSRKQKHASAAQQGAQTLGHQASCSAFHQYSQRPVFSIVMGRIHVFALMSIDVFSEQKGRHEMTRNRQTLQMLQDCKRDVVYLDLIITISVRSDQGGGFTGALLRE